MPWATSAISRATTPTTTSISPVPATPQSARAPDANDFRNVHDVPIIRTAPRFPAHIRRKSRMPKEPSAGRTAYPEKHQKNRSAERACRRVAYPENHPLKESGKPPETGRQCKNKGLFCLIAIFSYFCRAFPAGERVARMVEQVDTPDLKSCDQQWSYGFDSRSEYSRKGVHPRWMNALFSSRSRPYSVSCRSCSTKRSMRRICRGMSMFCGQWCTHWLQPMQRSACRSGATARP